MKEKEMHQNFAILGMFDRGNVMNVINQQPDSNQFIIAVVNTEGSPKTNVCSGMITLAQEKELLNNLGIRCNLLGYSYLLDALKMVQKNSGILKNITKELYPELAKLHKTQACNVERAIRHAIEHAWNIGNEELKEQIFGHTIDPEKGRPSNGEFLAAIAHYLDY